MTLLCMPATLHNRDMSSLSFNPDNIINLFATLTFCKNGRMKTTIHISNVYGQYSTLQYIAVQNFVVVAIRPEKKTTKHGKISKNDKSEKFIFSKRTKTSATLLVIHDS